MNSIETPKEVTLYYISCFAKSTKIQDEVEVKVIPIPCIQKKTTYMTIMKHRMIKFNKLMIPDSVTTNGMPSAMTYCLEADIEKACDLVKSSLEVRVKELLEHYTMCFENISKPMRIVRDKG
jgi:hypothetical protein